MTTSVRTSERPPRQHPYLAFGFRAIVLWALIVVGVILALIFLL